MNALITHKSNVTDIVLDNLAKALPGIIADALEFPGGRVAIVKPEQVSLEFSQASARDIGADIKIIIFARDIQQRSSMEKDLAEEILNSVVALSSKPGEDYSIDVRLYLMVVGVAEHSLSK
ncbi:MAG: hypothetical protein PHY09_12825 [Desulfuromonadaceae bacterium]|nr:hypothetical protein [Desulfuromonadaceae bacterium]MDD5106872.1 hypothetical protein [Desulfuromonadaceae bacterium]